MEPQGGKPRESERPPSGPPEGEHLDGPAGERSETGQSEPAGDAFSRGYARSRARDDAIRAGLQPLAPGERPAAIVVAAAVAGLIGLANFVLAATGWSPDGGPSPAAGVGFGALMLVLAAGMWRLAYLAVLAFQALLGISIIYAFLALLIASNLAGALVAGVVIVLGGTLFWFLVRPMARVQMTRRADRAPDRRVG